MQRITQIRRQERLINILAVITLVTVIVLLLSATANATTDLGNGRCLQDDGTEGVMAGYFGTPTDADCITESEYELTFSADNLVNTGVADSAVDNGDGSTTLIIGGAVVEVVTNALDRPVAATPRFEPDAPTVREVLFPATANRLAALVG